MYNLADIIRFKREHGLKFKESIACEYLTKQGPPYHIGDVDRFTVSHDVDFMCLRDITRNRQSRRVDSDTIVMHIRLFDMLHFVPDVNCYVDIIKKYNLDTKYRKCLLFYGNHKQDLPKALIDNSDKYIKTLKHSIERLGLDCDLTSNSVDDDFTVMATAKCYVAGYRGFGWLAACVNPNEVIWDIQDPPNFPWLLNKTHIHSLIKGYEFYNNNKHIDVK